MRKYESIVVFDAALGEEKVNKEVSKLEAFLRSGGASQATTNSWGRRGLAHKVGPHRNGVYVEFKFETNKHELVEAFTNQLRLMESAIKFQTHRIPDRVRKFQGRPGLKPGALGDWGNEDSSDDARY